LVSIHKGHGNQMNERIRELAKLADSGYTGNSEDGLGASLVGNHAIEKFAELIIRKCAKVADLADENKCEWIGGNILVHFGVKE
jgi:hypothetical protein